MSLTLYHHVISTCSQKVRLVLAEKDLDFESKEIDLIAGGQHDPEYVKLNPKHVVPTLVHDGTVLVESTLIIRYLDDAFPEPPLRSAKPLERYADEAWLMHADQTLHPAASALTFAVSGRNAMLAQPEELREANIAAMPSAKARAARRSVLEHGVRAPEFTAALGVFLATLDRMETELSERSWLAGDRPGLADATVLPYVLRMEHMAMGPLIAARPKARDWFDRWRERKAYQSAVDAWVPDFVAQVMRGGGEAVWSDVEQIAASLS